MEKVTVIVPIFNAEDYLRQCLDSITQQTYTNLEILLINDGSTDQSMRICEEYRQKDQRIRLITKKRGGSGVGAARNTALPLVTGDYVLFVDNDDWLERDHIEKLYHALVTTDSDIAVANFTEYFEDRKSFVFHIQKEDYFQKVYKPQEWFHHQYDMHLSFSQCFTVPWCKLYKASLFEYVVYPESERVEDDYTTWKIYLLAEKIVYLNTGLYFHRKRSESVTKMVQLSQVFPLRSIEERITLLSLIGFDVSRELRAYRWRLKIHKEEFLRQGMMQEYQKIMQKLMILEKWML